jgi:hypothetical protein
VLRALDEAFDVNLATHHEDDVIVGQGGVVARIREAPVGTLDSDDRDPIFGPQLGLAKRDADDFACGKILARAKSLSTCM